MFVANSSFAYRIAQRLFIELRITFRSRQTPDIDKQLDCVGLQRGDEIFDRPRRMADGPDGRAQMKGRVYGAGCLGAVAGGPADFSKWPRSLLVEITAVVSCSNAARITSRLRTNE